jgi:hypothetical protein
LAELAAQAELFAQANLDLALGTWK